MFFIENTTIRTRFGIPNTTMSKLFPEYLPPGSKGPAVMFLQLMLQAGGYNSEAIVADGDYGDETAEGVRQFQRQVDLDDDGAFGPDTRAKWLEKTGLDVNAIPALPDQA